MSVQRVNESRLKELDEVGPLNAGWTVYETVRVVADLRDARDELTAARQRIAELEGDVHSLKGQLYSEREAAMSRAEVDRAAHKDLQGRLCMILDAAKRIEAGKPIVMRLSESESVATLAARNAELEAVVERLRKALAMSANCVGDRIDFPRCEEEAEMQRESRAAVAASKEVQP